MVRILSMKDRMKDLVANVLGFHRKEQPDLSRLRAITAAQIPMSQLSEVEICDVRQGNETVFWRANYRARSYNCHSDALFQYVTVTRVG